MKVDSGDGWYRRELTCSTCGECGGVETQDTGEQGLNDKCDTIHYCDGRQYTCNGKPLNAERKYTISCGHKVGEVTKVLIEY